MNRTLLISIVCVVFIFPLRVSCQDWRGLQPLKSNCEDVMRALGVDKCEYPQTTYRLDGETVTISFESCPCPTVCYTDLRGWNVPRGTVGSIVRQLRNPLPISDFDVDSGKWTSIHTDFIGEIIYNNNDKGIRVSAVDGGVLTVTYYPPIDRFKQLRCPNCFSPTSKKNDIRSPVFIVYGRGISLDAEKYRLNEFALELRKLGQRSKAYIVIYNGCARPKGEGREYALRAQQHLLTQGISSRRILIIDGGQRESMSIELHGRARNIPPPKTSSSIYPRN
jgi:hypothetical protein